MSINIKNAPSLSLLRRLAEFFLPSAEKRREDWPTRAGWLYLGLIVIVAAAAFNTGNNLLFLVLGMMLAALLASFLISDAMLRGLRLSRGAPEMVTAGVPFRMAYTVTNQKRLLPSFAVRVGEELEGRQIFGLIPFLAPGETAEVKVPLVLEQRGRVKLHEVVLATVGPFAWKKKQRRRKLAGEIIVLPAVNPATAQPEQKGSETGRRPSFRPGRGEELFGFRGYRWGDPLKEVHWKTSARIGRLMVRELEAEEERRLRIVLTLSGDRPAHKDEEREEVIRQAAALAGEAIAAAWQVRLEAGGRGVDFGAGPAHLRRLILFLALFDDPEKPAGEILSPSSVPAVSLP